MRYAFVAVFVLIAGSFSTLAASYASSMGLGLSSHAVDVRSGSAGGGRVFIGGGLRGGK